MTPIRVVRLKHVALLDAATLRLLAAEIDGLATELAFGSDRYALPPDVTALMCDNANSDADRLRNSAQELAQMGDGATVADLPNFPNVKLPRYILIATVVGTWGVGALSDDTEEER